MQVLPKNMIPSVSYRIKTTKNILGTYHSNSGTHLRFIIHNQLHEFPVTSTIYSISKTRKKRKSRRI
uniref:Uncharacterized protein n=1 Tax=viral metagenome TaxID=1070528 RepID=A0A6C0B8Y1_9ZZZZ